MAMSKLDRSEISRALAKAIAYRDCGKVMEADIWAARLVELLGAARILDRDNLAVGAARESDR